MLLTNIWNPVCDTLRLKNSAKLCSARLQLCALPAWEVVMSCCHVSTFTDVSLLSRHSDSVCFSSVASSRSGRSKAAAAKDDSEEEDEEEEEEQEDEPTPKVQKWKCEFWEMSRSLANLNSIESSVSSPELSHYGSFGFFPLQGRKKAAGRRRWAKQTIEDKRRPHVYSEVVEEGRRKENMDIELFKLFIRRRSYCYTNSHTCIYHTHTTSVHAYHPLWFVALCCIVMMFTTLNGNHFNRKKKWQKITLVNSLLCLFHVLLLCLMLTGGML